MASDCPLHETHVTAIQRGLTGLPDGTTFVGAVRRPSRGVLSAVDENHPALAPPATVLDEFERRCEEFKMRGMCAEGAHNAAWEAEGVDGRYRAYVDGESEAQAAVTRLVERLRAGEELAVVCSAETARLRSHRTVLREILSDRL
ncbi:DUF488 family protein, N3 subclade [Candidatus Halobonum tyrrellensis]|uniref:DUF488 domain-containing protein n=1 Tax=Candidatus Halobonum tyrrellensis G22 TaxID=1324957 RepID=V4J404_9EURY|nr:hypothetical protein [Candidatus Halobonum tyrrellensis]ESP90112.1 hypothetical protein K933_01087 [Candidatus Halobonum tyrrellensis G22]